ncbi:MAG: metallophosphoesterase [Caulobacteraceae bacterium]|nr:metallophosphoesterase [Caulobacteraceae bacterium]
MSHSDDHSLADPARRKCMAWAGAGVVWSLSGGIASSVLAGSAQAATANGTLDFVQISDTHIGFNKPANPDVAATLNETIAKVKALSVKPAFVLHTGDISQLSKPEEFDAADQLLKGLGLPIFYTPGEHDTLDDGNGALFLQRYGKGSWGTGWRSFDMGGVHFIGLVNTVGLAPDGRGRLGDEQIAWLAKDVARLSASTPIVVYAHMPLFDAYLPWGWGTIDAAPALAPLKRFGSVTVLNGHVHQVITKTEGNMSFHTTRSTAFPQPAAGTPGGSPGPLTVPMEQLRSMLGLREIGHRRGQAGLALVDQTLA